MGHVILFDKGYFGGAHKHVFEDVANLNAPGDGMPRVTTTLTTKEREVGDV